MLPAAQATFIEGVDDVMPPLEELGVDLSTDSIALSEEDLRELIRTQLLSHLRSIGLLGDVRALDDLDDKQRIRLLHASQRQQNLARARQFLDAQGLKLLSGHFAQGFEIEPERIEPVLSVVQPESEDAALFRLATLLWSVPVSYGYGRRMRYVVRDQNNNKLIGIFSLADPVYNLRDRDDWLGWTSEERRQRLVNVMDAHVVGAVPPYNLLLGGKLVASLMTSAEVSRDFTAKYGATTGIISGRQKHAQLALLTVTSALGRSALYNRLVLPGLVEFRRIGATQGWGHFQVPEQVFQHMRSLLTLQGHRYASGHRYGMGPNWRIRVMREALSQVGLPETLLRHGIAREIYIAPLAQNWREYLRGQEPNCKLDRPAASTIARAALARWVTPRAGRQADYAGWTLEQTWQLITNSC